MKILLVTTLLPSRIPNGGELCTLRFIESLAELGIQAVIAGDRRPGDETPARMGWRVLRDRVPEYRAAPLSMLFDTTLALASREPISLRRVAARGWGQACAKLIKETTPDAIIADHLQIGALLQRLEPTVPLGMLAHNIEADIYSTLARSQANAVKAWVYRREHTLIDSLERSTARAMDIVWTVTEADRASLIAKGCEAARVHALPLFLRTDIMKSGEKLRRIAGTSPKYDLGMIGSWTWTANREGLVWFVENVVPLLPATIRIAIAGRGADWLRGRDPRIEYLGVVDSVVDFYSSVRGVAVPVFSGGGIQEKTVEALGLGLPVISTPFGARGISDPPPHLLLAEDAAGVAATITNLADKVRPRAESLSDGLAWTRARRRQYLREVEAGVAQLSGAVAA